MVEIKLDDAGMKEMLRNNPRELINSLGASIGSEVEASSSIAEHDVEVTVRPYTTDRAGCAVSIVGAGGLAIEAKHALLTRAAARAGLQVRRRG